MRKNAKPHTCDQCNRLINGPGVVVMGINDGKGLALPNELQERTFCRAACFWQWTAETLRATVNSNYDDPFDEP